ncbi:class I SAM-dependent methyltransferase [Piscirickettsia litoralis]|uniref:Glycosyl transferase family 2 n=1 Tax=Piscirickettsia litoralis TaxID=1891921 RepID=A0ABX3A5G9_9GAMM|nr:class I SAM-dependent methyltransferase [Piscirickettsia litoralis]ODN44104.1 glycosyl transferase family 2 [Piscirickettsia litoralis]
MKNNEKIFTEVYESHDLSWGSNESSSGPGSTLAATAHIRKGLEFICKNISINSLCDIPCGDFNFMKTVDFGKTKYIGCDIVKSLIEKNKEEYATDNRTFIHLDIINDLCPNAELIFCKELFLHISNDNVKRVIANIKSSGAKYFMANTYFTPVIPMLGGKHVNIEVPGTNEDVPVGYEQGYLMGRIVNLFLPPFNFPDPVLLLGSVQQYLVMALWYVDDLPDFK